MREREREREKLEFRWSFRVQRKPPTHTLLSTRLSLRGRLIILFEDIGRHFLLVLRGDGGRHEQTRDRSFRSTLCLGVSSDSAGPSASISKLGDVYMSLDRDGASLDRETERELVSMILVPESFQRSVGGLSPLFRARMECKAFFCMCLRL